MKEPGPTGVRGLRTSSKEDGRYDEAQLLRRIRSLRVEPGLYSRADEDRLLSIALGVPKATCRAVKRSLERQVASSARACLAEPEVLGRIERLPLRDRDTVVGLGDEMTSDRLSWFELLAAAYSLQCPGRQVRFVNMAAPGLTTTQMLDRMKDIRAMRPRLVLCMPGFQDARRSGGRNAPTVVSLGETDRNLFEMRSAVRTARWLWIVPPARRPAVAAYDAVRSPDRYRWLESDCRAIRALIRAQDEQVVEPAAIATPSGRLPAIRQGEDPLACDRVQILESVLEGLETRL